MQKCLWEYKKLARELKVPIVVYYSVAGHGKGLVDAMGPYTDDSRQHYY